MRTSIKGLLSLIVFVLGFFFANAQNNADFSVKFHSGDFVPRENVRELTKASAVLNESKFNDKAYVVIQFAAIPKEKEKIALKQSGIEILDYLPQNAFLAVVSANADLSVLEGKAARAVFQMLPQHKTMPSMYQMQFPAHAVKAAGTVDVVITTYEKLSGVQVAASFANINAQVLETVTAFKNFTLRVPQDKIRTLLALPFISWVEAVEPPNKSENEQGRTLHRVNVLNDGVRNLKGDGINMGIWDGGQINLNHLDFSPAGRVTIVRAGGVSDHATHVAGTMTGKGLVNPLARGMAPNAKLFSWDFNTNIPSEMANEIPARNLLVSNHSYGSTGTPSCSLNDPLGAYSTTSRNTDINLNTNVSHLHVHSAGNSGGLCSGGFMTITGSGKSAKNNLVVSNVNTTEAITGSSSRGPVHDGRIKPEISAMGTNVFSTWIPNNAYSTITGTSMATPGVTGAAALIYQRYQQLNSNANPASHLIKNIMCNASEDIGNAGPDYTYGFGRMNALSSVEILEQNRYALNTVATGASNDISITVPAGTVKLRVMLTWNDPAALANAATALVNNLDLTVLNGTTTTLPWIVNPAVPSAPATKGVDNYSNIEQVTIDNPAAGTYTLKVAGTSVPTGPSQEYSISWIIDQQYVKVLYPNGGENLSPGTFSGTAVQYITWDKAGITGNQTVEYSTDNGTSWTTLSTSVAPNVTRFAWNPIPSVSTSTALVRVSSGAVSDVSDATFNILGTPPSMTAVSSCTPGNVNLTWTAVANATHYDIFRLDAATGNYILLAANVTGTSYTATGLTLGTTVSFTHVAKNNTTGTVSQRSNAVSILVTAGGVGVTGSITGQANICGTPSSVPYSIAAVTGATSYTWTVPTGVTIVSGQGSTSITVSYSASAVSGNITVAAASGACQSNTSTLAVTVTGSNITPPVSGGNQSVTHCSASPMPTLTATATVAAGQTLVWYDQPTNGVIVVNPSYNSYGSVTYYAAAVDNATNCASNTRTPVTLTITQAAAATITANGPLSFCQGGSVQLTASTGGSYLWSNGATTQSITVNTGGNYSVVVTQGACSNSAAALVTVNPLPTISVTAGGPLTFCPGGSVQLTATTGNSYLWSNGATTQSITVNTAGNYSVTVNQGNSCVNTSNPVTVAIHPTPTVAVTAGGPLSFCQGGSVQLTATAASSYAWSNGATTQSVTANTSGAYSVTITDANGCTNTSAATTVTANALPTVSLSAAPYTKLFPGLTTVLTANATNAASYKWFKNGSEIIGATTATHSVSIDDLGAYSVTVTAVGGCSNNSSVINISDSAVTRLFVYPNPNKGQFQVSYHNAANAKQVLTIVDSKGNRVFNKAYDLAIPYQRMAVDMRRNSAGVYRIILSDRNGKKIATESVVIQ
ncbi:MAG: hypothetical protein EOP51_15540 [Sphingobacteriales bacterium]|nr:MAG: hypothetical protein EOP51_15540 [Sphingobacteriales bacterium]